MSGPRRFRAPAGNGEVLADPPFAEIPRLVAENRRRLDRADVAIGGMPLRELRALARREALKLAEIPGVNTPKFPHDAPLLLAGHQPELSHPGVWVKHFALNGLARRVGGVPLNLIVDNDTLKSAALLVPSYRAGRTESVTLGPIAFDRFDGETAYEDRLVLDADAFRAFPRHVAGRTNDWPFRPLLPDVWQPGAAHVGEAFTAMRLDRERAWGCHNHELRVSRLSQTKAFCRFAAHVLADLPRFAEVYNAAIRAYRKANRIDSVNHPAPDLAGGEAPFWVRNGADGRRSRATAASDPARLRPRALTLTLFARVCLGDFFIHGIGGGKYDEVTDAIIRDYFGIEPPAYQVLSATLHLPLPGFRTSAADLARAEWVCRDTHWNPQRHLSAEDARRPEVRTLVSDRAMTIAAEPPRGEREARRAWYRALRSNTERLRPFVETQGLGALAGLNHAIEEAESNTVLRRRDYSWVLYPEETLRPFLQRFLDV
ncbi:hypothetical protein J0H58_01860 [bacterium]|nr:hypothetical protein [bacterium]